MVVKRPAQKQTPERACTPRIQDATEHGHRSGEPGHTDDEDGLYAINIAGESAITLLDGSIYFTDEISFYTVYSVLSL